MATYMKLSVKPVGDVRAMRHRDWERLPVHAYPSMDPMHGLIRIDEDGTLWEGVSGGKRVTVRPVRFYS